MWKCTCGLVNHSFNERCADSKCSAPKPDLPVNETYELSRFGINRVTNMTDEERKALYMKFFGHEATAVDTMDYDTLIIRIAELESVAFEAKARLQAGHEKKRKFEYEMSKDERDRLISQPSLTVSEAIGVVSRRREDEKKAKDRMTKAEKFLEHMRKMGVSEKDLMGDGGIASNIQVIQRPLEDKRPPVITPSVTNNGSTQIALLAEVANALPTSIQSAIANSGSSIQLKIVYDKAKLAAHLAKIVDASLRDSDNNVNQ
jgi:hypothetical protein